MGDNVIYLAKRLPVKNMKKLPPKYKLVHAYDQLSKTDRDTLMTLLDAFLLNKNTSKSFLLLED